MGFVSPREYCEGCLKFQERNPDRKDGPEVYRKIKEASDRHQIALKRKRKELQDAMRAEQSKEEVEQNQHEAKLLMPTMEEQEVMQQEEIGNVTPPASPSRRKVAGSRSPVSTEAGVQPAS